MAAVLTITMLAFILFAIPTVLVVRAFSAPEKNRKDRLLELDQEIENREKRISHLEQRERDLETSVDFLSNLKEPVRSEEYEYENQHR
jgi:uncharacterized protein YlxW (UPF0749 family)